MDLESGKQRITGHIKDNYNKAKSLLPATSQKESSAMFPAHGFFAGWSTIPLRHTEVSGPGQIWVTNMVMWAEDNWFAFCFMFSKSQPLSLLVQDRQLPRAEHQGHHYLDLFSDLISSLQLLTCLYRHVDRTDPQRSREPCKSVFRKSLLEKPLSLLQESQPHK